MHIIEINDTFPIFKLLKRQASESDKAELQSHPRVTEIILPLLTQNLLYLANMCQLNFQDFANRLRVLFTVRPWKMKDEIEKVSKFEFSSVGILANMLHV